MPNLTFVIGQIRALESKLLNKNQIDRMVGAKTPLDGFRVLVELEYAEYIDDSTTPDDFETILDQGIQETRQQLIEGTDNHRSLHILWGQADANNLKRAFKIRFLKNQNTIDDFSENNGFSRIGWLSQQDVDNIVFHNRFPEDMDTQQQSKIANISKLWEKTQDILTIEYEIDRIFFEYFQNIAKKLQIPFIKKMVTTLIDIHNVTALGRCIWLRHKSLPQNAFIAGGTFAQNELQAIEKEDQFFNMFRNTHLAMYMDIPTEKSEEDKTMALEKSLDNLYNRTINDGQSGEINSVQVPISYFHRRLQNAKMIKFIMFSKFNGVSPDVIYENLKTF